MKNSQPPNTSPGILVLDDNDRWLQIAKSFLESYFGVTPLLASNGQKALDIVNAQPIRVALVDVNMPEMSGLQFLERIRTKSPETKVIMMSADFGYCPTLSRELIVRGAFAVISKAEIGSDFVRRLLTVEGFGAKRPAS